MGVDADPVMIFGLTVKDLGIDITDVTSADAFEDEQFEKDGELFDAQYRSAYSGAEDYDTYIGFVISNDDDIKEIEVQKERFKKVFGKEAKFNHFTKWW